MTRGLTPPRPDSELSKLKVRVFNLERILRGLRNIKPGTADVPAISLRCDAGETVASSTTRTKIELDTATRTATFNVKGRPSDGGLVILESALYAVTFATSFANSTSGARGAEVVRDVTGAGEEVVVSEGPVDAEASGAEVLKLSGATIVPLNVGDRLELRAWQTSGGDLDTSTSPAPTLGVAWFGPAMAPPPSEGT